MGRGHDRGREGERIAARYLEALGWRVLDRNWRAGPAELDLVVEKDGVVAFVEVKTRSGPVCGDPLEALTLGKRREIERAARGWIRTRRPIGSGPTTYRFDAVAVRLAGGRRPMVRHLEDAWRAGDRG